MSEARHDGATDRGDDGAGEHDSAMAIITRWRIPPENSCG